MSTYSIKDIETLTGIKSHTIRIWEQRYAFFRPERTDTNIRLYSDNDLKKLLNVSILNKNGYKISKIALMNDNEIQDKVVALNGCSEDIETRIKGLISAMFSFDEATFDKILTNNILKMGMKDVMISLIFPFYKQVGLLWQTGAINPAYEHFITNIIRQKLIVAIDGQMPSKLEKQKTFLLFLPEGETHEMGLLFANYLIRYYGHHTIYLGQNLPHTEVGTIFDKCNPDCIFSAVTSGFIISDVQQFVDDLSNSFDKCKIILSGYQVVNANIVSPHNVRVMECISEIEQFLSNDFSA